MVVFLSAEFHFVTAQAYIDLDAQVEKLRAPGRGDDVTQDVWKLHLYPSFNPGGDFPRAPDSLKLFYQKWNGFAKPQWQPGVAKTAMVEANAERPRVLLPDNIGDGTDPAYRRDTFRCKPEKLEYPNQHPITLDTFTGVKEITDTMFCAYKTWSAGVRKKDWVRENSLPEAEAVLKKAFTLETVMMSHIWTADPDPLRQRRGVLKTPRDPSGAGQAMRNAATEVLRKKLAASSARRGSSPAGPPELAAGPRIVAAPAHDAPEKCVLNPTILDAKALDVKKRKMDAQEAPGRPSSVFSRRSLRAVFSRPTQEPPGSAPSQVRMSPSASSDTDKLSLRDAFTAIAELRAGFLEEREVHAFAFYQKLSKTEQTVHEQADQVLSTLQSDFGKQPYLESTGRSAGFSTTPRSGGRFLGLGAAMVAADRMSGDDGALTAEEVRGYIDCAWAAQLCSRALANIKKDGTEEQRKNPGTEEKQEKLSILLATAVGEDGGPEYFPLEHPKMRRYEWLARDSVKDGEEDVSGMAYRTLQASVVLDLTKTNHERARGRGEKGRPQRTDEYTGLRTTILKVIFAMEKLIKYMYVLARITYLGRIFVVYLLSDSV